MNEKESPRYSGTSSSSIKTSTRFAGCACSAAFIKNKEKMYKIESGIKLVPPVVDTSTLLDVEASYLQKTFCLGIVGPPGSGKTTLIEGLLVQEKLYFRKFHRILIISPLKPTFLDVGDHGWWPTLKMSWLIQKIEEEAEKGRQGEQTRHVVVILDDVVSYLKAQQQDEQLISLFYNRRHFKVGVHVHFILTTQKWNMLPCKIRSVLTGVMVFPVTSVEWKTLKNELPFENLQAVEKNLPLLWAQPNDFIFFNFLNKKVFAQFDEVLL